MATSDVSHVSQVWTMTEIVNTRKMLEKLDFLGRSKDA